MTTVAPYPPSSSSWRTFTVHGRPVGQGSMKAFGSASTGRTVSPTPPRLAVWRADVREAAVRAGIAVPLDVPVELELTFYFARPKAHYLTNGLRPTAPRFPANTSTPDLDKLVRAIGDALTGFAYVDDALVVEIHAAKNYGDPRAVVSIREVP